MLRLVFTSERVRVGIVCGVSRALPKNQSYKESQKQIKSGLVPLLLLATLTAYVSLHHEQQSRKQNHNAIFTRLLNLTLLITTPSATPTYDVNENQPLVTNHLVTDSWSRTSN